MVRVDVSDDERAVGGWEGGRVEAVDSLVRTAGPDGRAVQVVYVYTFCRSNSARIRPFYNLRIRCSNPANLSSRTAF